MIGLISSTYLVNALSKQAVLILGILELEKAYEY